MTELRQEWAGTLLDTADYDRYIRGLNQLSEETLAGGVEHEKLIAMRETLATIAFEDSLAQSRQKYRTPEVV